MSNAVLFLQNVARLGITDLLSVPFDGFYLARSFAAGKTLPTTRRECLDRRIDEMLLGTEEDRKHEFDPPSSPPTRVGAASRMCCDLHR